MCGTGGQAKMIIKDGLIKVDGIIETRIRRKLTHGMIVKYDTQSLKVIKNNLF
jgi:ribosome-associated protein